MRLWLAALLLSACSSAEARVEKAWRGFAEALPEALGDVHLLALPPAEVGERLREALEAPRKALSRVAGDYRGLPIPERVRVRNRVARAETEPLRRAMAWAGRHSERLAETPGEAAYRAALGPVVRAWQESDALWALSIFSEETVEELAELASGKDD